MGSGKSDRKSKKYSTEQSDKKLRVPGAGKRAGKGEKIKKHGVFSMLPDGIGEFPTEIAPPQILRASTQLPLDQTKGRLLLIPTPIGNLEDMTFRAVRMLKEVTHVLAEDTRNTRRLLDHYGIKTPMEAYHQHNEHRQTPIYIERMQAGEVFGLVTDAGTPGISDPGFLLVRAARYAGIPVECLPGPTAFVPALAASGIPCDRFCFEGFLPPKKGRNTRIEAIAAETRTTVLYESPHRLVKCLEQLEAACGPDRIAGVFRELSKLHEEHRIGPLGELKEDFAARPAIKGEIVVVLSGR